MRTKNRRSGFTLLEHALILPGILFFILAALDINKTFQAYGALQEGVATSLRCLYPVDGPCNRAPQQFSEAPMHLYRRKAEKRWPMPIFHYSAETGRLEAPSNLYKDPAATVLQRVSYSKKQETFRSTQKVYQSYSHVSYDVMTAALPFVDNGTDNTQIYNPRFVLREGGKEYPSTQVLVPRPMSAGESEQVGEIKKSVDATSTGAAEEASDYISFQLPPRENPERSCFVSKRLGDPEVVTDPDFGKRCPKKVPIMLHIAGETTKCSAPEASGSVAIYIANTAARPAANSGSWKSLGGRMICPITGTGAEGNFYARGAWVNPPRDEDDEHGELFDKNSRVLGDHDHDEFYNGDSHVDVANPENPVWLRFVIKANSGSVAWKSTKVRVFSPIYGEYDSRVECRGEANTKNECIAKVSESGLPIPPALLDRDPQPDCTKTIGTRTTECLPETADRCGEAALSTTSCGLQDVQKTVQCCNADQNQGCANMSAPGDDQQCRFAATRDCGVSADDLSASSTGVRCAPGDIPLTLPQDFRQSSDGGLLYSRTSCDKPETPQGADLPDGLRRFASLHWGKVLEQAPVAIATGDVRPDEYRAAHSEYNCPFITPVMSNPLNLLPPQVRERSLLTGRHPMTCNWQEALREELGPYLGTGMYLNLSAEQVGERLLTERPTLACYDRVAKIVDAGPWEYVGGNYREGELPEFCRNGEYLCRTAAGSVPTEAPAAPVHDTARAEQLGKQALATILPWLRFDCTDGHCGTLEVKEQDGTFIAKGTVRMPLNVLLGHAVTVSFGDEEVWEGKFAR